MVSLAVNPGRHLHLKGHRETLVNKVVKPDHVVLTWHVKNCDKDSVYAVCGPCLKHTSQTA